MGGPSSSARIHDRGTKAGPHQPERPQRDSNCHISRTPEQRYRTSGCSTPFSWIDHCPRHRHGFRISPLTVLSDFTTADTSDDEVLTDPETITPHETFYLEDGNAEVLCGNTLFRVHTTVLSFHSPTLRQMFIQTALAAAESPNGCPRLSSTDAAGDFAMLLKTVYLPGYAVLSPG